MSRGGSKPGERRGGRQAGTPNKITSELRSEIRELAQQYGPDAILALATMSGLTIDENGERLPGSESETTRVTAIRELLDRGYGKATQPLANENGSALRIIVTGVPRTVAEAEQCDQD